MDLNTLKKNILAAKLVTIVTHKNPDGDAIGSALGLSNLLKKLNISTQVIVPNDFPNFLSWMEGTKDILIWENESEKVEKSIDQSDVIFCLDFNALHRIDQVGDLVGAASAIKVMIDHHIDPDKFCDYTISDTSASSTAELVYQFIEDIQEDHLVDKSVGEAIYSGIITDTGSFKFPSTGARTHEIASKLINKGTDNGKVHQLIYDNSSLTRLQLIGHCLDNMEIIENQYTLFALSKEDQLKFNMKKGDSEGIVNYGLSVGSVKASAFMKEDNGKVKISFRSKGELDMNIFARKHFNGGGHKNAAGGISDLSLSETIALFKKEILAYGNE